MQEGSQAFDKELSKKKTHIAVLHEVSSEDILEEDSFEKKSPFSFFSVNGDSNVHAQRRLKPSHIDLISI